MSEREVTDINNLVGEALQREFGSRTSFQWDDVANFAIHTFTNDITASRKLPPGAKFISEDRLRKEIAHSIRRLHSGHTGTTGIAFCSARELSAQIAEGYED